MICDSDDEVVDNASQFDENWRFLCAADVEANPVCRRLDKLIRHLFAIIYYNSKHPYDKDVIEFLASIVNHGEESTYKNCSWIDRF